MAQERANAAHVASVQANVERRMQRWARHKPLSVMLETLHTLLPKLVAPEALRPLLCAGTSGGTRPHFMNRMRAAAPRAGVKKAYKHALRLIHPDKLMRAPMNQRVAGQCALAALSQQHALEAESLRKNAAYTR